jgi:hypothetical protein
MWRLFPAPHQSGELRQESPAFVTGLTASCEARELCLRLQSKEFWAQYGVAKTPQPFSPHAVGPEGESPAS